MRLNYKQTNSTAGGQLKSETISSHIRVLKVENDRT